MVILEQARRELARSKTERDPEQALLALRQAAEKAWLHVAEGTDRLFGLPGTGPAANAARRKALRALDHAAGSDLLDDFERFQRRLHGACFYERDCPRPDTEDLIEAAALFPGKVRAAKERAP